MCEVMCACVHDLRGQRIVWVCGGCLVCGRRFDHSDPPVKVGDFHLLRVGPGDAPLEQVVDEQLHPHRAEV